MFITLYSPMTLARASVRLLSALVETLGTEPRALHSLELYSVSYWRRN